MSMTYVPCRESLAEHWTNVGFVLTALISRLGKLRAGIILGLFFLLPAQASRAEGLGSGSPAILTNIAYKTEGALSDYEKERCKLDLYLPAAPTGFPTLVWFHGGALMEGTKDDSFNIRIAQRMAQSGVAVAMVNYRLSPKVHYPAYIEDAAAAFAWTRQHIGERGGDAHKVFVGGHSAGGYLTFMVGLDGRYLRPFGLDASAIAGLIPISGQTMTHYTIREERGLDKNVIFADEAAPIFHLHKETPPMLVLYAEHDMSARAEENQYLAAAIQGLGNTHVRQQLIRDRDHGSIAGNIPQAGDPVAEAILNFIAHPQ